MFYKLQSELYKRILRPILFSIDPETVHDLFTSVGNFLGKFELMRTLTGVLFDYEHHSLEQRIAGIRFKSPVGLSAGFDKDANLVEILPYISFGFSEVGSITDRPYKGNPKPRLYRLPKSKGIVVYYGLKNIGATKILKKLKNSNIPNDFPISISIAKTNSKNTNTDAKGIKDYYECMKKVVVSGVGNFYTINISCPNTFGGEPFTTPAKLDKLLSKIFTLNITKPVFIKMPINLTWSEFDGLLMTAVKHNVTGVVIGNLNKDHKHESIKDMIPESMNGGVSGKPTWELSNDLISRTYKKYKDKLVIIGVGGIFSAKDAYEKIKRGASLVQLITGMIYEGPSLIPEINRGIVELLKKDGYKNLKEAIGTK